MDSEKRALESPSYTRIILDERRFDDKRFTPTWTPKAPLEEPPSTWAVIGSLAFYLVSALVLVMVNKWVLNAIATPLFLLLVQLIIAVLLMQLCHAAGFFALPQITYRTCVALAPLIACNCLGLAFNTYCLQFVDASFYQVARGLVLPFTVLFSHFLLRQRSSRLTLFGVALVCAGFVAGVSGERLSVSHAGVLLGVVSSVTTAIHAIVVKSSLALVSDTIELVYLNNLLSAFCMAPLVLLAGELPAVLLMIDEGGDSLQTFMTGALTTGVFGFLICVASFLSIKVTSPVSHMVSSAVRGVIQTYLGAALFGDAITSDRMTGIALILGGSAVYTWSKAQEGGVVNRLASSVSSSTAGTPPPAYRSPSRGGSPIPAPILTFAPGSPLPAGKVCTSPLPSPVPIFKATVVDTDDDSPSASDVEDARERVY